MPTRRIVFRCSMAGHFIVRPREAETESAKRRVFRRSRRFGSLGKRSSAALARTRLLVRNRRPFLVEAGHGERSDAIDRLVRHLRATRTAALTGRGRGGLRDSSFKGMGDFSTPPAKRKATVMETVTIRG
jgi:hypothetical protein